MTHPAPEPAPEPEPALAFKRAPASERAPADRRADKGEKPPGQGMDGLPPPGAGVVGGAVPYVAEQLSHTSSKTRKASFRSFLALVVLTVIAIGAVAAGIAAKSTAFWADAGIVFYLALAVVIAYAATVLGVVSNTTKLLRGVLKPDGSTLERTEPAQPSKAAPDAESAALVLARRFEKAGQLTEAEYAYLVAVEENGNPDALYWLGQQCVRRRQYKEGELWLLKAADRRHLAAAYLLGCLHRIHGQTVDNETYTDVSYETRIAAYVVGRNEILPDDEQLAQYAIVPSNVKSEILKDLADTLPGYVEFRQAYFASLLKDKGKDSTRIAIDKAIDEYPDNDGLRLLRIRLDWPDIYSISSVISEFPEYMHCEVNFHIAFKLINDDFTIDEGFHEEELREAIAKAGHDSKSPWRSQLLAIEAAYEYIRRNDQKAALLLQSALALKPSLAEPLSSDDVQSLALILKASGDKAAGPLTSALILARPKLNATLSFYIDGRKPVFKALISSMAPGIDISAPIPGSPAFSAAEISQLVDSAGGRRESEDQMSTGSAETEA